jgi:hypothetical protein
MTALPVHREEAAVIGDQVDHRIIFVGPYGVGKTTAIRAIANGPVIDTDVRIDPWRRSADLEKLTTTVGFDYGEWFLEDHTCVGLYGLPGQDRFDHIWDRLIPQADACIVWLRGDRADLVAQIDYWLDQLVKRAGLNRVVIAITRAWDEGSVAACVDTVARYHPAAPIVAADPRVADDVRNAIVIALATPTLKEMEELDAS